MATGPAAPEVDEWVTVPAKKAAPAPKKSASSQDDEWATVAPQESDPAPKLSSDAIHAIRSKAPIPFATEESEHKRLLHPGHVGNWRSDADVVVNKLPAIGGVGGGAIGLIGGAPTGPGDIATTVGGAAAGGVLGEDARQYLHEKLHPEEKKMSATESSLGLVKEGALQGAYELGGQVGGRILGRLARPVIEKYPDLFKVLGLSEDAAKPSPKAVGHLTAAAASKGQAGPAREAIAGTIGDIEQKIATLPPDQRTVGGFLDAVTRARSAIHEEYGNALGPYARQEVNTRSIADEIRALKKEWMNVPGMGKEEKDAIDKAATQFERRMTAGQLDSLREQLNTDLASLYGKAPNARYTATQGSINNAIDTTIARGARDILYPIADRAAGKPIGYFRDALDREGSLIQLRGILQKRVSDLEGSQAISEVTPRLSSENLSGSVHPGTMPRIGVYGIKNMIAPTRELKEAGKHVAKAFPTKGAVNSLPYQMLFANIPRLAPRKNATDEWAGQ